jgi:threonylcarbamoyladenosine tRNA methylthiotransferase CDKAL1
MNQGESRELTEVLLSQGHEEVSSLDDADLALINTCIVIKPTELKIMRRLRQINQMGKELIIAGCIPAVQRDSLVEEFPNALTIEPQQYSNFADTVRSRYVECNGDKNFLPASFTGILPVAQGCLGNCTYCLTKKARGDLNSYDASSIIDRAKFLVKKGAREIYITAQDSGCYGFEKNTNIAELLKEVVAIKGDFMVRVGMMNPDSLESILDEAVSAWRSPKVYKFLHLPVQSGSEKVLKAMGRAYSLGSFKSEVNAFRKVHGRMALSTDIITGFPGETEEDHQASIELIKRVRPSIVNVTRFSPSQGTPAAQAKGQVPSRIAKDRSREMTILRFQISKEYYAGFEGESLKVLITEKGKGDTVISRTNEYAPLVLPAKGLALGRWVEAEVVGHATTHLVGKLI